MSAYNIVADFEAKIAEYAGSKYAVAVESCTAALFLSLLYKGIRNEFITIPRFTYPGVACSILNAGAKGVKFSDRNWSGVYELEPVGVIDGALRFKRGMYNGGLHCLSFHAKKLLPIGRGGMILTDDEKAVEFLKMARFDGRKEGVQLDEDPLEMIGWNMYMTPEQAARGLTIFDMIKDRDLRDLDSEAQNYPDLKKSLVYQPYI